MNGFPQRSGRIESKAEAGDIWKIEAMEKVNENNGTRRDYRPDALRAIHVPMGPSIRSASPMSHSINRLMKSPKVATRGRVR